MAVIDEIIHHLHLVSNLFLRSVYALISAVHGIEDHINSCLGLGNTLRQVGNILVHLGDVVLERRLDATYLFVILVHNALQVLEESIVPLDRLSDLLKFVVLLGPGL